MGIIITAWPNKLFYETVNCAAVCVVLLQQCTSVLPTDSHLIVRMKELATAGVCRVPEVQRQVQSLSTTGLQSLTILQ